MTVSKLLERLYTVDSMEEVEWIFSEASSIDEHIAELEQSLASFKQTSGDLCPKCGWRGLRGDTDECSFCKNAEMSTQIYNLKMRHGRPEYT